MAKTFNCPNCGAPLDYEGEEKTLSCPFCRNSVIVPTELRSAARREAAQTRAGSGSGAATFLVLAVVGILAIGAFIFVRALTRAAGDRATEGGVVGPIGQFEIVSTASSGDGGSVFIPGLPGGDAGSMAQVTLQFGSEGIGPGMFDDARHVAVDPEGTIYVCEYSVGRVQVFDPTGKYLREFTVDHETPILDFEIDRQGNLYIVHGGDLHRFEASTGAYLGLIPLSQDYLDDIEITADNSIIGVFWANREVLFKADSSGNEIWSITDPITSQTDRSELDMKLAVDWSGNIYILGTFNNAVFKYDSNGKFLDRFSGEGEGAGSLQAPNAIGVDMQGNVYVGDIWGIQVFDPNGSFIGMIDVPEYSAMGIAFSDSNELYAATFHQIYKFELSFLED